MAPSLHSATSSPTTATKSAKPIGTVRRLAWLLLSGVGMVLWLQHPDGPWQLGALLFGLSGFLVTPLGSYRESVPAREAVLSVAAILLLGLGPFAAYSMFGWSLGQHPQLILAIKMAFVLAWLRAAIYQLRGVFAGHRN